MPITLNSPLLTPASQGKSTKRPCTLRNHGDQSRKLNRDLFATSFCDVLLDACAVFAPPVAHLSPFDSLCDDLILAIFSFIPHPDLLLKLRPVNRAWREITLSARLWRDVVVDSDGFRWLFFWNLRNEQASEITHGDKQPARITHAVQSLRMYATPATTINQLNAVEMSLVKNMKNLRSLSLSGVIWENARIFQVFLDLCVASMPALQHLELYNSLPSEATGTCFSKLSALKSLTIQGTHAQLCCAFSGRT